MAMALVSYWTYRLRRSWHRLLVWRCERSKAVRLVPWSGWSADEELVALLDHMDETNRSGAKVEVSWDQVSRFIGGRPATGGRPPPHVAAQLVMEEVARRASGDRHEFDVTVTTGAHGRRRYAIRATREGMVIARDPETATPQTHQGSLG